MTYFVSSAELIFRFVASLESPHVYHTTINESLCHPEPKGRIS